MSEILYKYHEKIYDIFFPHPYLPTIIPEPFSLKSLRETVKVCDRYGIQKNMLVNALCFEVIPQDNLIKFCLNEGIDSIAISNFYLMKNTYDYKMEMNDRAIRLEASVGMSVRSIEHYKMIADMVGGIVMDVDAYCDRALIEAIQADGKWVKAVVNDGCIFHCPVKDVHRAHAGHRPYFPPISTYYCDLYFKELFTEDNKKDLPIVLPEDDFIADVIWKLNLRKVNNKVYQHIVDCYLGDKKRNGYEVLASRKWELCK